jgi:nitroimidazol reductase NimA-like FMN-containing flavoprotein (pyridoxamine 5'-phosphate oxidase superfamily)
MTETNRQTELLRSLDEDACRRLLVATRFGRIAVIDDGEPRLVVLNHLVDHGDVLFRTRDGSRLAGLTADRSIMAVYEVDSAFAPAASGWSVIATGHLARETDPARCDMVRQHLTAWARGERGTILVLHVGRLTGRQAGSL